MRRLFILVSLLLLLSGCAVPPETPLEGFAPAQDERLVIYTSCQEPVYRPIIQEFENRTGIWVQVETGGAGALLDRLSAEADAPACDLLFGGGADSLQSRPALFEPYASPLTGEVQPAFRCPEETWTAFSSLPVVLIYNPVLVRSNPPDSWQSLLDPAWHGKIAFASPTAYGSSYTALAALLQVLPGDGQELLSAFYQNLGGQVLEDGPSQVVDSVADGSSYIGVLPEDAALQAIASGRDVALVRPKEGTCLLPDSMAVVSGCAHGDNARRFIDFVLRQDVQRYLVERCFRRSVRTDLAQAGEPLDTFDYDAAWASEQRDALLEQWQALSGDGAS